MRLLGTDSICPTALGHQEIKWPVLLMFWGGVHKLCMSFSLNHVLLGCDELFINLILVLLLCKIVPLTSNDNHAFVLNRNVNYLPTCLYSHECTIVLN